MVKNTRTKKSAGELQPLNQPSALSVQVTNGTYPDLLRLRGRWITVEKVVDRWRIDDEWWREEPISRMYYKCVLDQQLQVTVFHNLITGDWYLQKI